MNNFCNNDCLWLLVLLFCCGGCGKSCGGCNIDTIILLYLLLCCGGCGCGCKDAGPNYGFGCK